MHRRVCNSRVRCGSRGIPSVGFGFGVAGKEHLYDSSSKPGTEEWSGVGEVCFARVGHDFVDDKWV